MKAAVYIRVSRPDELGILANQREAALAYAQRLAIEVVEPIHPSSVSDAG